MARVRTFSPKKSEIERGWRVIDAEGETLGRLATRIAAILRGKDKPTYTMHMSVGDNVIVVNAEKVRVTGQKEDQKTYYRHTQYPGGLRAVTLSTVREKHPERIIQNAVKGMLPHNRLGRQNLRRLHVYAGPEHPHEAQVRAGMGAAGRRKQAELEAQVAAPEPVAAPEEAAPVVPPTRRRRRAAAQAAEETPPEATATETQDTEEAAPAPTRRRRRTAAQAAEETPPEATTETQDTEEAAPAPTRRRRRTTAKAAEETPAETISEAQDGEEAAPAPTRRRRRTAAQAAEEAPSEAADDSDEAEEQG
ncbi:MAG: 50S ribosomal protein L13 [Dehalococcoidia bacterium]|nr:50S ribosomal protein L13 [Dehalococcoidia bacterium]